MAITFKTDPLPVTNLGERHVICVANVDISGSMTGKPIDEVNKGLVEFGEALKADPLALGRAEVAVVSFETTVKTELSMRPAAEYEAPVLTTGGLTAFNQSIQTSLDMIEARKDEYKSLGMNYYRPWLFVLTDGVPTDTELEAATKQRLQDAIRNGKVIFMPMAIGAGADKAKLQEYYPPEAKSKPVLIADKEHFKEAFVWLSKSVIEVAKSNPDTTSEVQLPPTPSIITVGI